MHDINFLDMSVSYKAPASITFKYLTFMKKCPFLLRNLGYYFSFNADLEKNKDATSVIFGSGHDGVIVSIKNNVAEILSMEKSEDTYSTKMRFALPEFRKYMMLTCARIFQIVQPQIK